MVSTLQRLSLQVAPLRLSRVGCWPRQKQRKNSALGSSNPPWWDKISLTGLERMRKPSQSISHRGRGAGEDSSFSVTGIYSSLSISKVQCKNLKDSQASSKASLWKVLYKHGQTSEIPVQGAPHTNNYPLQIKAGGWVWKSYQDSSWILHNLSVTLLIPKP